MSTPMSDRAIGINTLGFYREASLLPNTGELIEYFDNQNPALVGLFGKSARSIPQPILKEKLHALAMSKGMTYPTRAEINSALMSAAGHISTVEVLQDAAVGTMLDLRNFGFKIGLVSFVAIAGIGYVIFFTKTGKAALKEILPMLPLPK